MTFDGYTTYLDRLQMLKNDWAFYWTSTSNVLSSWVDGPSLSNGLYASRQMEAQRLYTRQLIYMSDFGVGFYCCYCDEYGNYRKWIQSHFSDICSKLHSNFNISLFNWLSSVLRRRLVYDALYDTQIQFWLSFFQSRALCFVDMDAVHNHSDISHDVLNKVSDTNVQLDI